MKINENVKNIKKISKNISFIVILVAATLYILSQFVEYIFNGFLISILLIVLYHISSYFLTQQKKIEMDPLNILKCQIEAFVLLQIYLLLIKLNKQSIFYKNLYFFLIQNHSNNTYKNTIERVFINSIKKTLPLFFAQMKTN
jgi:hypothetical protein